MNTKIFYYINYSTDYKITGTKEEQISGFKHDQNVDKELLDQYQDLYYDFLNPNLDLLWFKSESTAKPTDILSSRFLHGNGLFVSEDLQEIIEQFKCCNIKFLRTSIDDLSNSKNYFFMNVIKCQDINFEKSKFQVDRRMKLLRKGEGEIIKIKSFEDYRKQVDLVHNSKGMGYTIVPKLLTLSLDVDLLMSPFDRLILVSEKLKDSILRNELSGVEFSKVDLEFHLDNS